MPSYGTNPKFLAPSVFACNLLRGRTCGFYGSNKFSPDILERAPGELPLRPSRLFPGTGTGRKLGTGTAPDLLRSSLLGHVGLYGVETLTIALSMRPRAWGPRNSRAEPWFGRAQ